jgi:hypothetical protein
LFTLAGCNGWLFSDWLIVLQGLGDPISAGDEALSPPVRIPVFPLAAHSPTSFVRLSDCTSTFRTPARRAGTIPAS